MAPALSSSRREGDSIERKLRQAAINVTASKSRKSAYLVKRQFNLTGRPERDQHFRAAPVRGVHLLEQISDVRARLISPLPGLGLDVIDLDPGARAPGYILTSLWD